MRRKCILVAVLILLLSIVPGWITTSKESAQTPQSELTCWKSVLIGDGSYEVESLVLLKPNASAHVDDKRIVVRGGTRVEVVAVFTVGDFRVIRFIPYKVTFNFRVEQMEKETRIWMLPKMVFGWYPDFRYKNVKLWFQAPEEEGIYNYNVSISIDGPKASAEDRGILTLEVNNSIHRDFLFQP